MKLYISVFLIALAIGAGASTACIHPKGLSPVGVSAFNKHRVIDVLDLIRNVAVDGEKATPQVVTTPNMLKVVKAHRSILLVIDATDTGWKDATGTALDQLLNDLPKPTADMLRPYVTAAKAIIKEIG